MKKNLKKYSSGFTLLEILLALVILAMALTTGFYALIQNTTYRIDLKNKLEAHWVALELFNQYKLDFIADPKIPLQKTDQVIRFHQQWYRTVAVNKTEIPAVLSITAHVAQLSNSAAQSTLQGYVTHVE